MSEEEDKLAKELIASLDEVLLFQKKQKSENMSLIQTRILLNSKLSEITRHLNSFSGEIHHTTDYKIEVMFKILEKVTLIYNSIQLSKELEKVRLEYLSLTNFIRMQLASFHQDSDKAQSLSTASILSNMLIDEMPKLDKLPIFPEVGNDPLPYMDQGLIPYSNLLQSSWGIYQILLEFIPVLPNKRVIEWSENCIRDLKLYTDLFDGFDVYKILKTRKVKDVNNFFDNILGIGMTFMDMALHLVDLNRKFGGVWPETLDLCGVICSPTFDQFDKLIMNIKEKINIKIEEVTKAKNDLYVSKNDSIEDSELYTDFQIFMDEIEFIRIIMQFYKAGDLKNVETIKILVDKGVNVLHSIIELGGGHETVLQSYYLTSYSLLMQELLPFVVQESIIENNPGIYENFKYEHRFLVDQFSIDMDAPFYYLQQLCNLYFESYFHYEIDFKEKYIELYENLEYFYLKPRIYLTIVGLLQVISFLVDDIGREERAELLAKLDQTGVHHMQGDDSHTNIDFLKFQKYIQDYEDGICTEGQIRDIKNIPDEFAWLIPDLSYYFEKKGKKPIQFVPFNLGIDSIKNRFK